MAKMKGTTFLDVGYDLRDVDSWAMLGVLFAWVALFRLSHYAAFAWEVLPYMASPSNEAATSEEKTKEHGVELA